MKCPNCGNQEFERLDYSIVRCTNCYSLFDPYVYPGFPEPKIEVGQKWDTTEDDFDDWEDDA
jgi:ribosomal protein L37AE/L43A